MSLRVVSSIVVNDSSNTHSNDMWGVAVFVIGIVRNHIKVVGGRQADGCRKIDSGLIRRDALHGLNKAAVTSNSH